MQDHPGGDVETLTIYMLYDESSHRAYFWPVPDRDDAAAIKKARTYLKTGLISGKLFTGPTGEDEMKFLCNVWETPR